MMTLRTDSFGLPRNLWAHNPGVMDSFVFEQLLRIEEINSGPGQEKEHVWISQRRGADAM